MRADELAGRLGGKKSGRGYSCKCPAHGDKKASLSVSEGRDGGVVIHCHAGCTPEEVLGAMGLDLIDLAPEGHQRTSSPGTVAHSSTSSSIVATYDYLDACGDLLFQVCRMSPKAFRQRRPDGRGGWIWGRGEVPTVLYQLPEVLRWASEGWEVYLVEGEKDVATLQRLGYPATTSPGGAAAWRSEYAEALRGAHVVVVPDRDAPGDAYADAAIASLLGVAASVRRVMLPGLAEHGDVTDWLAGGHTCSELEQLARDAPLEAPPAPPEPPPWERYLGPEVTLVTISEPPPDLDWLFYDLLSRASSAGLTAPGGTGKSYFLMQLFYHAAWGRAWGPFRPTRPIRSLILAREDCKREVEKRLWRVTQGHNPPGYHVVSVAGACGPLMTGTRFGKAEKTHWWHWLDRTLALYGGDLDIVILDPRSRFYGLPENDNDLATQWSDCVEELVQKHNVASLTPHHVGKAAASSDDLGAGRSRGASAFADACRLLLDMGKISEKEAKKFGCKVEDAIKIEVVKNNNAAPWPGPAYFHRGIHGLFEPWDPEDKQTDAVAKAIPMALAQHRGPVTMRDLKHRYAKAFFAIMEDRIPGLSWEDLLEGVDAALEAKTIFLRRRRGDSGQAVATLSLLEQE